MSERKCKCGGCKCGKKDEGGMGGPKPYSTEESPSPEYGDQGMGGPKGYDHPPADPEPDGGWGESMGGPKGY